MDSQHVQEIERHAVSRGWISAPCPRCRGLSGSERPGCCDGLRRVLTFPDALGEISFEQYEQMHIVQGLEKRPAEREPVVSRRLRSAEG